MKKIKFAIFSMSVFLSSFASAQVQVIVPVPHPVIVVAPRPQPVIVVAPSPAPVIVVEEKKHNHGHAKGHGKHGKHGKGRDD